MADSIKKFFQNKRNNKKFQSAGQGRKLNATPANGGPSTSASGNSSKDTYVPLNRKALSVEARNAAEAAMSRTSKTNRKDRDFNSSLATIKAQVRRELEEKDKVQKLNNSQEEEEEEHNTNNFAVQGVYFGCPFIGEELLTRNEWKLKIKSFLYDQLVYDKSLTACLIIVNCNVKDKADACIDTLSKYLENIINNPNDEKYRKIRMSNRIFCDKVRNVEGALDFLYGAGFTEHIIDNESFLIYSEELTYENNKLPDLLEALRGSEIIPLELDRNIQVLSPVQARNIELPPDFFRITKDEIKREQLLKSDALENTQILKTKAMRDREELRIINKYKFSLIRVRFPDGVFLQGTFNVYEKLSDVFEFVQSCLKDESIEFTLVSPTGNRFSEEDREKSLYELRLIPKIVLIYAATQELECMGNYLKDEILMLIQD